MKEANTFCDVPYVRTYDPITDYGANLTGWFRGDKFQNISSSLIDTAVDKGGAGNDYTGVAGGRPVKKSDSLYYNRAHFGDAGGGAMRFLTGPQLSVMTTTTAFDVVMAFLINSLPVDNIVTFLNSGIWLDNGAWYGIYAGGSGSGGTNRLMSSVFGGGTVTFTDGVDVPAGTIAPGKKISLATSLDAGTLSMTVNNVTKTAASAAIGGSDITFIAGAASNTSANRGDIDLYELIVAKAHSATPYAQAQAAMQAMYRI